MAAQTPNVYERARQLQAANAATLRAQQEEAARQAELKRDRTVGEFAGDVGLSALGGAVGLGGAAFGLANVATGGLLDRATGFSSNLQETQQTLDALKSDPLQARKARAAQAFQEEGLLAGGAEYVTNPSLLLDVGIQSLPYIIPGTAVARAAGGAAAAGAASRGLSQAAQATVAQQAATRAGLVSQGALTGGYLNPEGINAAREAGLSEGAAQLAGLGAAAVGAITGPLISKVTGAAGLEARAAQVFRGTALPAQAGGAAARVGTFAGVQAVEEAAQEGAEQAIINVAGQRPIGEGVGESAVVGGLLGLGLGGAMGLTQIRQPSLSREEAQQQRAAVEAELAGGGPSPLRPSAIQRAEITAAQSRQQAAEQRLPVMGVEEISAERAVAEMQPVEEIDLGAAPAPGLTGLNAVLAQQRAIQATQPPRMGVQELTMEQFAPTPEPTTAGLPAVEEISPRNVQDIIRETAPIARVAQQFGAAAAGREAARRATVSTTVDAPVAAPIDISEPKARGAFTSTARSAIAQATGLKAQAIRGDVFNTIVEQAAVAGAAPGTPEFAQIVGAEANRALAFTESTGKTSALLGSLVNSYPVDPEVQADIAAGAQFDRQVQADEDAAQVDTRLASPAGRATLRETLATVRWDERGGLLLRDAEGAVTGRTKWLSSMPEVSRVLTDARYTPADVAAIVDKVDAGQATKLTEKQRGVLVDLLDVIVQPTVEQETVSADASTPAEVTATPARYNPRQWAEYMAYPGAEALNALTAQKELEANPQPVLAAMLGSIENAQDITQFNVASLAANAHPEFAMMSQDARGQVSTQMAVTFHELTGATFELGDTRPRREISTRVTPAQNVQDTPLGQHWLGRRLAAIRQYHNIPADVDIQDVLLRGAQSPNMSRYLRAANIEMSFDDLRKDLSDVQTWVAANRSAWDAAQLDAEVDPRGVINDFDPMSSLRRYEGAEPAANAKFREGGTQAGMNQRLFDKGVESASTRLGIPIFGFNTVAELSESVGSPMPEGVKGMFYNGQIYVVRENTTNAKDLAFTIAHELGHSGLGSLLGTSLKAATNRMWANSAMRERIKGKMAELNLAQTTEGERNASRTLAAEEVLADMLASGEKLNKDIYAKLRAGVREFLARAFGVRSYIVTNQEVDDLLSDVARVINGAPAAQVQATIKNPGLWITNPFEAAESNPKFSKVKADLDQIIADAEGETARVIPMHDIAKAAGAASVDAAKAAASAIKHNKPGELYINNAMHLNQLADWYDKMFKGRIGTLAALKRGKEAFFNQQNSRPAELKYDGKDVANQSVNDVAKEWSQFGRQNPHKFEALNNMMQYSTFYKVFPDRAWSAQNEIDYDAAGYSLEERQAAHAQMASLYKSIGPQGQALYKKSQAIYEARWNTRFETLMAELDRIGKVHLEEVQQEDGTTARIAKYKADIRNAMKRISEGPYSPLQRNGEHLVVARNSKGEVVHFSAWDTREEAEIARKQVAERMRAEGETDAAVAVTRQKDFDVRVDGASRGTIETLTSSIRSDMELALPVGMDPAARNQVLNALSAGLTEAYLQALPQNAFMKHARNRKNVEGFDVDAFRAFADYTLRSARDIAGIKFDGQIGTALNDVQRHVDDVAAGRVREPGQEGVLELDTSKLQSIADAVKSQHAASLEVVNNKAVNALSQGAFVYFMTSPSQMFLNATQTYMVAFPRLAGMYGAGRAIRELNKAAGQYFKSGFDLLGDKSVISKAAATDPSEAQVAGVLQALHEDGTLDFTQAHDLAELSGGGNTALSPYMSKAMEIMSYAMHKSEVFNRQVTASAAVRLELDKMRQNNTPIPQTGTPAHVELQARLADVGRRAIDTTHFDYSQSNKPALMQGPIGKLVFQFQQYRFHMLAMIGKDIRDAELGKLATLRKATNPEEARVARETLGWLLGMQLAFTGTAGTILAPFVFAIADAFKDDDDLTNSRQDWINAVGKYAAHGVGAGLIDTGRIGMDTLIPYLGDKAYEPVGGRPSDVLMYHVSQNLGPWVGLLGDAFDGSAALMNGDVYKASQDLLPKPFRDVTKSLYEGVNGVRDARGVLYNEPSVLSGVTQFLGLRSAERRDVEADRSAVYRAKKLAYGAEQRYLTRLVLANTNGDATAAADAMADINAWNARYPDLVISGPEIRRAMVTRLRTEQVAGQTGIVSSRMPGPTLDAVLGR